MSVYSFIRAIVCFFSMRLCCFVFFFFNAPATTEIYTLSLHDALPICIGGTGAGRFTGLGPVVTAQITRAVNENWSLIDRKSTRLNSSHTVISYAVFCLKKKNIDDESRGRRSSGVHARCSAPRAHPDVC